MKTLRLTALLGVAAAAVATRVGADEHERHTWALGVERTDDAGQVTSWSAAGPLLFSKRTPEGGTIGGFRPFWVQTKNAGGDLRAAQFLYPVFSYRADGETYAWSLLELVKRAGRRAGAPAPRSPLEDGEAFDIWPFWFSRHSADPRESYHALFPVAGTIKSRLGYDRLSWALWPFYFESEKHGAVTTQTPWPIVRTIHGAAHGFALWPLFGWEERPGVSREEFYLWPLGYNNTIAPAADAPAGTPPERDVAALPLFARSTKPGFVNQDFLWPFFGYTDRTAPSTYHETRYLWPFLVQGRGDDRFVNRWGPFYTHSIVKGHDKTWVAWPLFRHETWSDEGLAQTKTQFLYFLYWSLQERSRANPSLAPASITHVWPLFSTWDNGAGRRQVQVLSPFEVFFPGNEKVREAWSPLFALFRYDERDGGREHFSLLWDLITWERHPSVGAAVVRPQTERVALAGGLVGLKRNPGQRAWRLFWLDFPRKHASSASPSQ